MTRSNRMRLNTVIFATWGLLCSESALGDDSPPSTETPSPPATPTVTAEPPRMEAPIRKERPAEMQQRIAAAEASLAGEPTLAELLRAALARADAGRAETERWKRTVRLSAILPTLRVSGD